MNHNKKNTLTKRYVVQRNELLHGKTTVFNITDLKIFKLIISKVNSKNILFDDFYEITSDELKALNINPKHLYNLTLTSLKKLANVYMKIDMQDNKGNEIIKEIGLIQNNFTFKKYSNKFYISFHQDMKDYLLDIQEKYTRYPLADISNLKLKHSLKFYEYLKSISFNEIVISIEKLKKRLDIDINSYKNYGMFKKKVIEPVIHEINDNTSLNISYEPIKDGRKVTKLKLMIQRDNLIQIKSLPKAQKKYDEFNKYLNVKFIYNDEEFIITEIDKNQYKAQVKNINTDEIGIVTGIDKNELKNKLKALIENEN
jgi:plasmid replication initiation protein